MNNIDVVRFQNPTTAMLTFWEIQQPRCWHFWKKRTSWSKKNPTSWL